MSHADPFGDYIYTRGLTSIKLPSSIPDLLPDDLGWIDWFNEDVVPREPAPYLPGLFTTHEPCQMPTYELPWDPLGYATEATSPTDSMFTEGATTRSSNLEAVPASDSEAKHQCTECHRSFETAYLLERHARDWIHKTFSCPEPRCGKRYCRRDLYTRHKRIHKDLEVHTCEFCETRSKSRTFTRKDHLLQHIRNRHSGGKPTSESVEFQKPRSTSLPGYAYTHSYRRQIKERPDMAGPLDERINVCSDTDSVLSALDTKDLIHEMMRRQSEQSTVLRVLEKRLEGSRQT